MNRKEFGSFLKKFLPWAVLISVLLGFFAADNLSASVQAAAHRRWGNPIAGTLVTSTKPLEENPEASLGVISFTSRYGGESTVQRLVPTSWRPNGGAIQLWESEYGEVFVHGEYLLNELKPQRTNPWPLVPPIYFSLMVTFAAFGWLIGYLGYLIGIVLESSSEPAPTPPRKRRSPIAQLPRAA